ncbi:MAG: sigma 54-interacting transcriptional regulator, partial [Candidatus Tantalella remota]|nr:sigma 54-interacting transcriptional regulator [Candidatus Tantalella remota]
VRRKIGKFEAANGGTLFLDEIGNLPMDTQTKLLRTLQEKEIVRVGGNKSIKVDVRIVSATNQDLGEAMLEGRFKSDLYYRLNVVSLHIPPLRERREDIPLLVDYSIKMYKDTESGKTKSISKAAMDRIVEYDWPGNVRELENVVERAIVTGKGSIIWPEDLPETVREHGVSDPDGFDGIKTVFDPEKMADRISFGKAKNKFEKDLIHTLLKKTNGNLKETTRRLGITPRSLRYMVKKYGLKDAINRTRSAVNEQFSS